MKITTSLIISTYNWVAALELCLQSVMAQVIMPDEIIIADDGSGEETKALIEIYKKKFSVPLKHVWQPDEGYQLAKIRNKAFAMASADYVIQIDGDLILHPYFIFDHLRFCKQGTFVSGKRALINEGSTKELLKNKDAQLIKNKIQIEKKHNALRLPLLTWLAYVFQRGENNVYYVLGCNMAFWRKDLLVVNGYNEEFSGWGKEDNDIAARLINMDVKLRLLKFGAIVYHLYHNEASRAAQAVNDEMFRKSMLTKKKYISKGIDQYLTEK